MSEDPRYDRILLDAPKYAGVEIVRGDAVIIRIIAKTAPEQQFTATRVLRQAMKEALDAAGIKMPVQTVRFASDPRGDNQDPSSQP